jgi:hypothetical protein
MAIYTLIAHKPESADYCRGCLVGSWSGDFHMENATTLAALSTTWKRLEHANLDRDRGEARYDLTLLINGMPLGDIGEEMSDSFAEAGGSAELVALGIEARAWMEALDAEIADEARAQRELAEQAKAAQQQAAAQAQEARDRAQYAELHERFAGGAHA